MNNDQSVAQWYIATLNNEDARELLHHVAGCTEYGSLKSWQRLPEAAKQVLRDNYQRLLNQTNGGY